MPYIIALLALVVIGVGFTLFKSSDVPQPESATVVTEQPAPEESVANMYKDGTYTTTTTYQTPARAEYSMEVTLIVANNTVTDSQIVYSQGAEKDPNAQRFDAAYRTEIIGKTLDTISLSRVGGASLTTGAFNKALETIKTDAQS